MQLCFFAPFLASLKSLARIAVVAALSVTASHAEPKLPTQQELQIRLQEAQADPELWQRLHNLGGKVAAVCANCHGDHTGNAVLEVPYLAGQNPAYLVEQVRQFSQGIRKNTFMEGILKALSRDEMVGMVLFYEKEKLPPRPAKDLKLLTQGKNYYERVCVNCHAADGHGNERLPRIAGQHMGYVELTLQRYRDGSSVRSDANMAFVTKNMSDAEIKSVAAYLQTMP